MRAVPSVPHTEPCARLAPMLATVPTCCAPCGDAFTGGVCAAPQLRLLELRSGAPCTLPYLAASHVLEQVACRPVLRIGARPHSDMATNNTPMAVVPQHARVLSKACSSRMCPFVRCVYPAAGPSVADRWAADPDFVKSRGYFHWCWDQAVYRCAGAERSRWWRRAA